MKIKVTDTTRIISTHLELDFESEQEVNLFNQMLEAGEKECRQENPNSEKSRQTTKMYEQITAEMVST